VSTKRFLLPLRAGSQLPVDIAALPRRAECRLVVEQWRRPCPRCLRHAGEFVPQMINLKSSVVNFRKGCYPGRKSSRAASISASCGGACMLPTDADVHAWSRCLRPATGQAIGTVVMAAADSGTDLLFEVRSTAGVRSRCI
jgi:hypothetical protein